MGRAEFVNKLYGLVPKTFTALSNKSTNTYPKRFQRVAEDLRRHQVYQNKGFSFGKKIRINRKDGRSIIGIQTQFGTESFRRCIAFFYTGKEFIEKAAFDFRSQTSSVQIAHAHIERNFRKTEREEIYV